MVSGHQLFPAGGRRRKSGREAAASQCLWVVPRNAARAEVKASPGGEQLLPHLPGSLHVDALRGKGRKVAGNLCGCRFPGGGRKEVPCVLPREEWLSPEKDAGVWN